MTSIQPPQSERVAATTLPFVPLIAPLMAASILLGCWGGDSRLNAVPVYPVDCRLFAGGKPAAGAVVSFHPGDGPIVTATVHSDGRFVPSQSDGALGLPEGRYSLTAIWRDGDADRFGGRYSNPRTPIARVTVQAGVNLIPAIQLPAPPDPH